MTDRAKASVTTGGSYEKPGEDVPAWSSTSTRKTRLAPDPGGREHVMTVCDTRVALRHTA